jgi:hypothetical protein
MMSGLIDPETYPSLFVAQFSLVKSALSGIACKSFPSSHFRVAQSIPTASIFNHWDHLMDVEFEWQSFSDSLDQNHESKPGR